MNDAMEVRAVRAAHGLNVLFVIGTFAAAIANHARQPARIPLHFDLAGVPDRWGDRSWGNTLAVPLVGLAITALIYAGARIVGWARRHPELLDLPDKKAFLALPPDLQEPIWRQMKALFYWLAVPQTLVFLTMAALAPGDDGRLRVWPIFVPTALLFALVAVLAIRLSRAVRRAIAAGAERARRGAPQRPGQGEASGGFGGSGL
ncbi:MAG TPA: DUF1648 domain-containing protein [Anaeromyxobacter sp.]|nr:DUF1648 domain-containing protein [Anaeromyxobacter sp.]